MSLSCETEGENEKNDESVRRYYVFSERVPFRVLDHYAFWSAEIPRCTFFLHRLHSPWSNKHTAAVFFPSAYTVPDLLDGEFCSLMQDTLPLLWTMLTGTLPFRAVNGTELRIKLCSHYCNCWFQSLVVSWVKIMATTPLPFYPIIHQADVLSNSEKTALQDTKSVSCYSPPWWALVQSPALKFIRSLVYPEHLSH